MNKLQGCVYSVIPFWKTHIYVEREKVGVVFLYVRKKDPACDTVFGFLSISIPWFCNFKKLYLKICHQSQICNDFAKVTQKYLKS